MMTSRMKRWVRASRSSSRGLGVKSVIAPAVYPLSVANHSQGKLVATEKKALLSELNTLPSTLLPGR